MTPQMEKKILNKLDRIEKLIIKIIPRKNELTEEDVLEIVKERDRDLRDGKTKILCSLKELR
jgi:hypothetical protein